MINTNILHNQSNDNQGGCAALARWVYLLNELLKEILNDLKDGLDEEDFDRCSFDQDLEEGLRYLLEACPVVDPCSLDEARTINPYLSAFICSLEQEVVEQDVDHFQQLEPHALLQRIRENLDCDYFCKGLASLRRNENFTSRSLLQYILDLKAAYSKLMIIRLDLYTPSYLESVRHWEQLKKYVAERYVGAYVGFAVKFEYGQQRGVHMHTMLFFNGSVVRQDVTIAKSIGEYWKSSVTAGEGTYSNCNAPRHLNNMRYPAVGTFQQFDERTLKGLKHITSYLTKQDLAVRFAVPGLSHTLRRGCISKKNSARIAKRGKRVARLLQGAF
nr:inovirus-type Gp2 protein [uncultured Comamonas sp.]